MTSERLREPASLRTPVIIWSLVLAKLLFHLLTANRFGIFRDELYYLACAEHLDWGYVDQPPLIALVAWIARHLFGESLFGLRLIPAIAGAGTVWITAKLAREIGGRVLAQTLAAISVMAVPIYLIVHHWLTMNAWEPLIFAACALFVARALRMGGERNWIPFGLVAGIGLENKYTIVFFIAALVAGLLVTSARRQLASRYFWIGAAVAAAIFLPNFVWLVAHHFPFLELMHNIRGTNRDITRAPVAFVLDQIMTLNPLTAPVWIAGLVWLVVARGGRAFAALGWTFVFMLTAIIVMRGKNYYLASAYPMLFAAGGVAFENIVGRRRWIAVAYAVVIIAGTAVVIPTISPILSPDGTVAYQRRLGIESPKFENQETGPLPQYFADEFGWEEMTRETARVYHSLPPEERARTAIFANGYGQAGAIDFFGPRYGLPKCISNHQNYWLWGPRNYDGSSVIVLGGDGSGDRKHFRSVEAVGQVAHPFSRRDEHFDIFLCRDFTGDLRTSWSGMKKWR